MFVHDGSVGIHSLLVQLMALHQPGNRAFSDSMTIQWTESYMGHSPAQICSVLPPTITAWSLNQSSCRFLSRCQWMPSGKLTASQWLTSRLKLLLSILWFGKRHLLWRVDYLASSPLLCSHPRPSFSSVNTEAPNSFILFGASRFTALRKPSQRIFRL